MEKKLNNFDIIVVGAGISGLYAAKCLTNEGLNVHVLETQNHVGGRAFTYRHPDVGYCDFGGAYFGKMQTKVLELARQLGLEFYSIATAGKTVFNFDGKVKYFEGDIPPGNIFQLWDLSRVISKIDRLSLQIPLTLPWTAADAVKYDSMTVFDFLNSHCWTKFAAKLIYVGFASVFAAQLEKISMLYCLHLVRSCGGVLKLFGDKDGFQEFKLDGGSNAISEKLYSMLPNKVTLNSKVTHIEQTEKSVSVITTDGVHYQAERVIVACSPTVLQHVKLSPTLPPDYQAFVDLNFEGHYFKTVCYYDKAYWKEKGLRGDLIGDGGIVAVAYPDTKQDGTHPAIMGFVDGEEYEKLTEKQREEAIANHYAKVFGVDELKHPIAYLEKHWASKESYEMTGSCVYSVPPRFLTTHKRFWGEKFQRLHFCGSETSMVCRGYMDGAVRAAQRVTTEILQEMGISAKNSYHGYDEIIPVQ